METSYSQWCKLQFAKEITELEPDIRNIVEQAFTNVNEQFWHAPASSTGKYHPLYACGDGGVARHTLAAVHFCKRAFISIGDLTKEERDIVIAAMLLHDTCKSGLHFESQYTVFEHPILVKWLYTPKNTADSAIWAQIITTCASHMGRWNTPSERDLQYRKNEILKVFQAYSSLNNDIFSACASQQIQYMSLPKPKTKLQKIVANSDYTAADKECMLQMFDSQQGAWQHVVR